MLKTFVIIAVIILTVAALTYGIVKFVRKVKSALKQFEEDLEITFAPDNLFRITEEDVMWQLVHEKTYDKLLDRSKIKLEQFV